MTAAQASPTLCVKDIERTAAFYGVTLGFDIVYPRGERGGLIVLVRGGARLHFSADGGGQAGTVTICLDKADARSLSDSLAGRGVPVFDRKSDDSKMLEAFAVCDPDGHRITVTTRVPLRVVTEAETTETGDVYQEDQEPTDALFAPDSRRVRRWLIDWRTNSPSLVFAMHVVGFTPAV